MKAIKNLSYLAAAGLIITTFPGCNFVDNLKESFTKKTECTACCPTEHSKETPLSKDVLVTINGEEVINKDEFNAHLAQMIQAYPQLRGSNITPQSLPAGLKRAILEKLVQQKLIEKEALDNKIESTEEFQKSYKEAIKNLKQLIIVSKFENDLLSKIGNISYRTVVEEYEKNKTRFPKVIGGVITSGISFDTQAAAQAFLAKVKGRESEFNKLASEEVGGKFRNFGTVNQDSFYVEEPIKNAVLDAKKYPFTTIVKTDKENWVIFGAEKKEPVYKAFDEVKVELENAIKGKLFQEELEKKMNDLKKRYSIKVNEQLIEETPMQQMMMPIGGISAEETEAAISGGQEVMKQKQAVERKTEQKAVVAI